MDHRFIGPSTSTVILTTMNPPTPDFFADPRLLVEEHGHDAGSFRLTVFNGTGLPLALIVVSAELRHTAEDEQPFEILGPVTLETWAPPFFPAGSHSFEFELTYPEELAGSINDAVITYVVVASEYTGPMDEDLLSGNIHDNGAL